MSYRTKAARVIRAAFGVSGIRRELPSYAAMMSGAIDGARTAMQAVVEPHAVCGAHAVFLAADGGFTTLKACALTGVEAAGADAFTDALLLVFTALVDGCGVALHGSRCRRGLRKANG